MHLMCFIFALKQFPLTLILALFFVSISIKTNSSTRMVPTHFRTLELNDERGLNDGGLQIESQDFIDCEYED